MKHTNQVISGILTLGLATMLCSCLEMAAKQNPAAPSDSETPPTLPGDPVLDPPVDPTPNPPVETSDFRDVFRGLCERILDVIPNSELQTNCESVLLESHFSSAFNVKAEKYPTNKDIVEAIGVSLSIDKVAFELCVDEIYHTEEQDLLDHFNGKLSDVPSLVELIPESCSTVLIEKP